MTRRRCTRSLGALRPRYHLLHADRLPGAASQSPHDIALQINSNACLAVDIDRGTEERLACRFVRLAGRQKDDIVLRSDFFDDRAEGDLGRNWSGDLCFALLRVVRFAGCRRERSNVGLLQPICSVSTSSKICSSLTDLYLTSSPRDIALFIRSSPRRKPCDTPGILTISSSK